MDWTRRLTRRAWGQGFLAGLGVLGCSEPAPLQGAGASPKPSLNGPRTARLVELFSWWTAPGEAEALDALVAVHQLKYPDSRLFNAAAASGTSARETLAERLTSDDPPDLFQLNAHDVRSFVQANPNKLEPLDELFNELQLKQIVYPEVLQDVTVDGHYLSLPINLHRENSLFYNRHLLAAHNISPPTTLAEFILACKTLKAVGVTPLATSYQGWILRIMFNSLAMGSMGAPHFRDVFSGRVPMRDEALLAAVRLFVDVLDNYVNVDAADEGFGWTNAVQAVQTGDAAMLLHGDWATGYFKQLGFSADTDFGVIGAPGAAELFLYGVDVFALPRGAVNREGAREFLTTIASPEAQIAFNRIKGSSPIRPDISLQALDPLARLVVADLQSAKIRMLVHTRPEWDDAFSAFATSRNVEALYQTFLRYPAQR